MKERAARGHEHRNWTEQEGFTSYDLNEVLTSPPNRGKFRACGERGRCVDCSGRDGTLRLPAVVAPDRAEQLETEEDNQQRIPGKHHPRPLASRERDAHFAELECG